MSATRVSVKDIMAPSKGDNFSFKELENEFARVSLQLTFHSSPFYASVLMQCARIYSTKLPTMAVAVTQQVLLIVNPDFFMGRLKVKDKKTGKEIEIGCKTMEQRVAVVEHELLHLIFYHLSRGTRHKDAKTSNIAADAVCNQYVRNAQRCLPGEPVYCEKLNLPKEKDLDFYYNELMKKKQAQQGQQPGSGEEEGEYATSENGRGSHDAWGDQPDDGSGNKSEDDILKDIGVEGGGLSEEAREAIVRDVIGQAASRDGKEGLSKLPGAVAGQVEAMLKPKQATQPWNVILRRFTGTHGSSTLKSSRKYQSRRYRDPITGRKARPGLRVKRQRKFLVAIDTSGSMAQGDLELLAGELSMIARYNRDITVIECDTQINRKYQFRGELKSVCGRGGTDMWPVRREFEEGDYDALILMTDGYVGDIGERPRKGWLWVITHGGTEPAKWGMFVHLPDSSKIASK